HPPHTIPPPSVLPRSPAPAPAPAPTQPAAPAANGGRR
ncbi:rod shape-determining protein MreC, partial [Pseudomonas aeruginosa]|nr:rod shape-determining protein MreC [Pseudomonas aeruginosa]